jgi:inorganic pyrophosphatase
MSASTWVSKPICSNPLTLFGWCAFLLLGCAPDPTPNPLSHPTYSSADSTTVNVVIEIPAGSNDKVEIDKATGVFEINRVIQYLPYPVNYGFIPSTLAGDGDALDVLVLSKRLETGTVLSAIPIATMILRDKGEMDDKVLLIPADSTLRVVPCDSWMCLQTEYPAIVQMLEIWFTTYKPAGVMVSGGWVEADSTRQLILNTTLD